MKHIFPALRFLIFFTLLLGFVYPVVMTNISQFLFPDKASGSFIKKGEYVVGSLLIGQNFEKPEYFWPRPSVIGYNALPSGGSNLGQSSLTLKQTFDERKAKLMKENPEAGEPPQDLLFASASGLDPHISPRAAEYQLIRVAKARSLDIEVVKSLINETTNKRQWGIFGEPTVNLLALNLALDRINQK